MICEFCGFSAEFVFHGRFPLDCFIHLKNEISKLKEFLNEKLDYDELM